MSDPADMTPLMTSSEYNGLLTHLFVIKHPYLLECL